MIYWDATTDQQIVRYHDDASWTVHLGCAKHPFTETEFPHPPTDRWVCLECQQRFKPVLLEQKPASNPHFL